MDARTRPAVPEYTLDLFADPTCVKDIVKAILHTIFFHRYFHPITPLTRDLLDMTLPAIDDPDIDNLIDQRAATLVRSLDSADLAAGPLGQQQRGGNKGSSSRAQVVVQFFEKRRRKTYFSFGKADEEVVWEQWTLDVSVATPRTETDVVKVRRAMEKSLFKTATKIVGIVNREKDHIPPITTTESNAFPYQIVVNPKQEGWTQRGGIFYKT